MILACLVKEDSLFSQELLKDESNQLFFGEVGKQMVRGLMIKAEKVRSLWAAYSLGAPCMSKGASLMHQSSAGFLPCFYNWIGKKKTNSLSSSNLLWDSLNTVFTPKPSSMIWCLIGCSIDPSASTVRLFLLSTMSREHLNVAFSLLHQPVAPVLLLCLANWWSNPVGINLSATRTSVSSGICIVFPMMIPKHQQYKARKQGGGSPKPIPFCKAWLILT